MACSKLLLLLSAIALSRPVDTIRSFSTVEGPAITAPTGSEGRSFSFPAITPLQFLIISSPSEKKVVWTTLKNFESSEGRVFPLITTGLLGPRGMTFDHKRGFLYVADEVAQKIYRYSVLPVLSGPSPRLVTSGVRLTITQGHPVEWVTVDDDGNLFYTAPDTNNINKITAKVMDKIDKGEFPPSTLQIVSEKTLEAASMVASAKAKQASNAPLVDPPPETPHIYSIYEANLNPHVSAPASIWADGPDLYWTNQKEGTTAGTIVKGEVQPKSVPSITGPAPFPAVALTNISEQAFGIGKTNKIMFFSRNGPGPNTGLVTGLLMGTNTMADFVKNLAEPRGIVWDKEQTMYVADEKMGNVWSFPTGRLMADVPLTKVVHMNGAHGLILLSSEDPAFSQNQRNPTFNNPQNAMPMSEVVQEEMSLMQTGSAWRSDQGKAFNFLGIDIGGGSNFLSWNSFSRRGQGHASVLIMLAAAAGLLTLRC